MVFILATSCAVSRMKGRTKASTDQASVGVSLAQRITNQNLTVRNFFVERAEFKIKSLEGEKSGIGTIKFLTPDKFLVSLKSNAGIEVARIYISGDSIFVNDRFNKKLYYGSTSYLKEKYGLTTFLLPVALGDYVNDEKLDSTSLKCIAGKLNVEGTVKDVNINYLIDCESGKSIRTSPEDEIGKNLVEIDYSDFFKINNITIPGKIEIKEEQSNTKIEIVIKKIITPWEGTIEFIPGKQFKKIRLL